METYSEFAYIVLAEKIRSRIASGELKPRDRLGSVRKISAENNCSPVTVLRAIEELAANGEVTSIKRKGVFVREKPFPVLRPTRISIVKKGDRKWPTTFNVYHALQEMLMQTGHQITIQKAMFHPNDRTPWQYVPAEEIVDEKTSLVVLAGIYDFHYLYSFMNRGVPVIAHDVNATGLGIDSAFFENVVSATCLTEYLVKRGHRTIAYLGGPLKPATWDYRLVYDPSAQEREIGYRHVFAARGREQDCHVYHCSTTRSGPALQEMAGKVLEELPDCTGIVSENYVDPTQFTDRDVEVACWREPLSQNEPWPRGAVAVAECDEIELAKATAGLVERRLQEPGAPVQQRPVYPRIRYRDESQQESTNKPGEAS